MITTILSDLLSKKDLSSSSGFSGKDALAVRQFSSVFSVRDNFGGLVYEY